VKVWRGLPAAATASFSFWVFVFHASPFILRHHFIL
jgi:hypothetical protein